MVAQQTQSRRDNRDNVAVHTERKKWPVTDSARGLVCRRCGCADLRVETTRYAPERIVRYRLCRNCGKRITTYEATPATLAKGPLPGDESY